MSPFTSTNFACTVNTEDAFELGRDYVLYGATHDNCHFNIFCSPENTAAWEAGRLDAERTLWSVRDDHALEIACLNDGLVQAK